MCDMLSNTVEVIDGKTDTRPDRSLTAKAVRPIGQVPPNQPLVHQIVSTRTRTHFAAADGGWCSTPT
jgi:hypothetical protein